jgi:hypothetical protein
MSRHIPDPIGPLAWRAASAGLIIVTSVVIIATLLVARQGQAINMALIFDHFAEGWTIRSGSAEADRVVLRPTARSIGLALRSIDSPVNMLQTRVAFDPPQGAAGLIVQADDADHFSAFLISGDGYFRISDYRNGVWIDRVAWRAWPHIRRAGTANVLRAECQSDTCTFFVNDEWTWQEAGLPAARWIGVIADAQSVKEPFEARFDQLGRWP